MGHASDHSQSHRSLEGSIRSEGECNTPTRLHQALPEDSQLFTIENLNIGGYELLDSGEPDEMTPQGSLAPAPSMNHATKRSRKPLPVALRKSLAGALRSRRTGKPTLRV